MAAPLPPHHYPWTSGAAEVVRRYPIADLVRADGFRMARLRGRERLLQSIEGEIRPPDPFLRKNPDLEVLSHPFARMLLACLRDAGLARRYAVAEAKRAYAHMLEEEPETLRALGGELGLEASLAPAGDREASRGFWVDFARYAELTAGIAFGWKLVNRTVVKGRVRASPREFARLLQEVVQRRLAEMPPPVDPGLCRDLGAYLEPVRSALQRFQREKTTLEAIDPALLPPCMRHLLESVATGPTHVGRFALAAFLLNIGLPPQKLLEMFQEFPDFRTDIADYQIRHIAGQIGSRTEYTAPSCATMKSYGLCVNADNLCARMNEPPKRGHPLTYYRIRTRAGSSGRSGK